MTVTSPPRYRSILVPVDGGRFGEHALPLALGIARRAGAEVRVVHVHCPLESTDGLERLYYSSAVDAFLRRRHEAYLENLYRRMTRVTSVPVTPVYLRGREVADSLCEAASSGTDLVVMATHGRGRLKRLWFGSVADVLLLRLSVPLLFVRGYNAPVDLTGDPLLKHVLVPLDGSAGALKVLDPATALGALTGARFTLSHVIDPTAVADYESHDWWGSPDRHWGRLPPRATRLRDVAARMTSAGLGADSVVLFDKDPARAILGYARDHDVDLIALAASGGGGLRRLFLGSVADRVVRGASVPVMVFRPDDEPEGRKIL